MFRKPLHCPDAKLRIEGLTLQVLFNPFMRFMKIFSISIDFFLVEAGKYVISRYENK